MTDIVDPGLEAYATAHTTAPPDHLEALAAELRTTLEHPHMMVGRLEGRYLEACYTVASSGRLYLRDVCCPVKLPKHRRAACSKGDANKGSDS